MPARRLRPARVLSGLVVKAPFFLVVRLWFDVMPGLPDHAAAQMLGVLAAAAILFGSVLALRQVRLKLLIAYSTVAQIGYLFLMFPLAGGDQIGHPWGNSAWTGGVLQAISHAFAKAAMFMAAGLVYEALGHDRIAGLAGIGRALPITVFAFGLGGMSLMGLPPSGGFVAKAMLLTAAVGGGPVVVGAGHPGGRGARGRLRVPWWWPERWPIRMSRLTLVAEISRTRQAVVLAVALVALMLGFVPLRPSGLLLIGRPDAAVMDFK